jgi:hypothetical protein
MVPNRMDKIDRYVDRVQRLAPAPKVVAQVLLLFADPNREVDRLAELISYDPSLTVEMLRRSNSAFFRGAEPASDVFEAVTRLGFNEAQSVTTALVGMPAASLTGGETPSPDPASSNPEAMTLLELTAEDVQTAGEQIQERLRQVQELLQIPAW